MAKGKFKKHKKPISFDEEVITKDDIKTSPDINLQTSSNDCNGNTDPKTIKNVSNERIKNDKSKPAKSSNENDKKQIKTRKTKLNKIDTAVPSTDVVSTKDENSLVDEIEDSEATQPIKKGESIRSQKRKRHVKLSAAKRLKTELNMQTKAITYLSNWKHNREQWKFEKIMQLWLAKNLFDEERVPQAHWDTTVAYFENSLGAVRRTLKEAAVKLSAGPEEGGDDQKVIRAKIIIEALQ